MTSNQDYPSGGGAEPALHCTDRFGPVNNGLDPAKEVRMTYRGLKAAHTHYRITTGKKRLDKFAKLTVQALTQNGFSASTDTALPGCFRPTKEWDVCAFDKNSDPVVVIELKAQGRAFGKNFNNRIEEMIGQAIDLRMAHKAGHLGNHSQLWFGYGFVVQSTKQSSAPCRTSKMPHKLSPPPVFVNNSYIQRYENALNGAVQEGILDAAFLIASETQRRFHEPRGLDFKTFVSKLPNQGASWKQKKINL